MIRELRPIPYRVATVPIRSVFRCRSSRNLLWLIALVCTLHPISALGDTIEFLSGAKMEGTVTKIDQTGRKITFDTKIRSRTFTRVIPYSKVHAVVYGGKRYVLNERSGGAGAAGGSSDSRVGRDARQRVTPADVADLIDRAGRTPPEWYASTPLDYPKTLDLSWPQPPPKGWNNQKNVGQYIWDIINPNPGRWREGVRLLHHLLSVHQGDDQKQTQIVKALAGMYFRFFQDYARAAFWWQKAAVRKGEPNSIALAECYWRLGNKQMAEALLDSRRLYPGMVKLYGDMGETQKALQVTEAYVRAGGNAQQVYLLAGDACRGAGDYRNAMRYYEKVLATRNARNKDYDRRAKDRARDSLEAIKLFDQFDLSQVVDGTFTANSPAYNGPLEVQVKVVGNRIQSIKVTDHTEKQFYSALTDTTAQIIEKQSVKGVDTTSGATVTSVAIVNATAKALTIGAGRRRPSRSRPQGE